MFFVSVKKPHLFLHHPGGHNAPHLNPHGGALCSTPLLIKLYHALQVNL